MVYQAHLAREIVEAIQSRGWNLYDVRQSRDIVPERIVYRGPSTCFEIEKRYVLLPQVGSPKEYGAIVRKLHEIELECREPIPSMVLNGTSEKTKINLLKPGERSVTINVPGGERQFLSYQGLLDRIETLTLAR